MVDTVVFWLSASGMVAQPRVRGVSLERMPEHSKLYTQWLVSRQPLPSLIEDLEGICLPSWVDGWIEYAAAETQRDGSLKAVLAAVAAWADWLAAGPWATTAARQETPRSMGDRIPCRQPCNLRAQTLGDERLRIA